MEAPEISDVRTSLLAEVERFAERVVARRAERPERPMDARALGEVLDRADAIGLAGADDEPSGLGLWEDALDDAGCARSIDVLARLGRANAAVAYGLHQRALGRALVRELGLEGQARGPVLPVAWGIHGIGREPLARLLAGADLDAADRALLADVYTVAGTRIVTSDDRFAAAILPFVDADGQPGFALVARDALRIAPEPHAHGLDELATARITPARAPTLTIVDARARDALSLALGAESLAHVAIALGAAASGHALARRYAAGRRQGGAPIDRHAAVRLLLARGRTVLDTVEASLARAASRGPGAARTIAALGMRSEAHPLLSMAVNDSLQAFGGIGYMRDTGLEKIVRDTNHLRVLGGSPTELALVVAEWERLHG